METAEVGSDSTAPEAATIDWSSHPPMLRCWCCERVLAVLYNADRPLQDRYVLLAPGFGYSADDDGIWRFTKRAITRESMGIPAGRRQRARAAHDPNRPTGLTPQEQRPIVLTIPATVQCAGNGNECVLNRIDQETHGPLYHMPGPVSAVARLRPRSGEIVRTEDARWTYPVGLNLDWGDHPANELRP